MDSFIQVHLAKTKKELIEIILKQDLEIQKLSNLNKFIKGKLDDSLKGNITVDPIVNKVIEKHLKRHQEGMVNFGKTMSENNKPFKHWVKEAQEESMDFILYLEKALNKD